ncbi:MAG: signal peptide protein [Mitsuaria chitosanitabida]|uniref:hypothetical protein n=1 Tax=Roseateles chitosanitabidus TaxID=65048 RepID=UPI001B23C722|nr:hypothetical protein [Roseateles chitosanitabidus]MBO9688217.1 signal peptide protein [Roseateles chitosanitabidus]
MHKSLLILCLGTALAGTAFAQMPAASAPAAASGVSAVCKDGTPFSGDTLKGACKGHGGVDKKASAAAAKPATAPMAAAPKASAAAMAQAPGGGAGKVWANASSKVYHCEGDRYYGKTKQGEYMSEADAKAKGFHGDHGKSCAK